MGHVTLVLLGGQQCYQVYSDVSFGGWQIPKIVYLSNGNGDTGGGGEEREGESDRQKVSDSVMCWGLQKFQIAHDSTCYEDRASFVGPPWDQPTTCALGHHDNIDRIGCGHFSRAQLHQLLHKASCC